MRSSPHGFDYNSLFSFSVFKKLFRQTNRELRNMADRFELLTSDYPQKAIFSQIPFPFVISSSIKFWVKSTSNSTSHAELPFKKLFSENSIFIGSHHPPEVFDETTIEFEFPIIKKHDNGFSPTLDF